MHLIERPANHAAKEYRNEVSTFDHSQPIPYRADHHSNDDREERPRRPQETRDATGKPK